MNEFLKNLIIDIVIAAVLAAGILFFIKPTFVQQTSMVPTFEDGDYVITYRRAYVHKAPERGDVVIFESSLADETGKDKLLIKRVIGLPGDEITIDDGLVYINGTAYVENYLNDGYTPGEVHNFKVPEDSYYCMGDNRVVSIDSRSEDVGPVHISQFKGKVVIRLFPFNRITTKF